MATVPQLTLSHQPDKDVGRLRRELQDGFAKIRGVLRAIIGGNEVGGDGADAVADLDELTTSMAEAEAAIDELASDLALTDVVTRETITGDDRITLEGSERLRLVDEAEPYRVFDRSFHSVHLGVRLAAPGTSFTVPNMSRMQHVARLELQLAQRITLAGYGRLVLVDEDDPARVQGTTVDPVALGVPAASRVSWRVQDGWQLPIVGRLELVNPIRGTILGRARILVLDSNPVQRLTLQGSAAGR